MESFSRLQNLLDYHWRTTENSFVCTTQKECYSDAESTSCQEPSMSGDTSTIKRCGLAHDASEYLREQIVRADCSSSDDLI